MVFFLFQINYTACLLMLTRILNLPMLCLERRKYFFVCLSLRSHETFPLPQSVFHHLFQVLHFVPLFTCPRLLIFPLMLSNVQLFFCQVFIITLKRYLVNTQSHTHYTSFNQNDDINENLNMLFNHLERMIIIFNQVELLCQFKELLMRNKFVNSVSSPFL